MITYDKSYISKKALDNGFNRDTYEKVLRLIDVLNFLNLDDLIKERLALKGGTAINLLEFDLPRLSVDIDLDYVINNDVETMKKDRDLINNKILVFMERQGYIKSKNDRHSFISDTFYFTYTNSSGNKDNIKLDINYAMRAHLYKIESRLIFSKNFEMESTVNSLNSIETFGSKINALNNRAAVRDLYDIYKLVKSGLFENKLEELRKCVIFYHVLTSDIMNGNFDLKASEKLNQHSVLRELVPVLKKGEVFILDNSLKEVKMFINNLMMMTESEQQFINKFKQGEYCPDLLFLNNNILIRIATHPMAIWKTRQVLESINSN